MKKRVFGMIITFIILLIIPVVSHAEIINSGNCGADGANVTWTLNDAGTLTISGEGKMEDYSSGYSPWNRSSHIKKVLIEEGVISIGSYAFEYCTDLTSVTMPDSVTNIGDWAFSFCSGLTSVAIGSGVTSIGDYAFSYCSGLTGVAILDSVTSISNAAFYWCSSLTSVTIPDSVTSIGNYAFYYCSSLTSITIPDSVTTIGRHAFGSCNGLTSIIMPNSVTNIGNLVFSGCDNLTSVAIGSGLESIGTTPFYLCNSLTNVNYNASKVFSNMFDYNDYYNKYNNILLIVLGDNVKSIDTDAFTDCANLKRIIIPKSVTEIERAAFKDCTSLTTVEYGGSETDWNEMYIGTENENLTNAAIHYNSALVPTPKPTPVPITTAEILKTEADTAYTFTVTPETAYENCFVYAAIYDADGVLLGVNRVPLQMAGSTSVSVDKQENGITAKVFVWSDFMQSIIEQAKEFPLT